jgi:hypothetical protein
MASDNRITAELNQYEDFDYTMRVLYMTKDSGYYSQDPACSDLGLEDTTFLIDQDLDYPLGLNPSGIDHEQPFSYTTQSTLTTTNAADAREYHDASQTRHGHFERAVARQDLDLGSLQLPVRADYPRRL